ncbi:MAG: hypothetical protein LBC18_01440 [Opitutaceae bacterium]|jgi:hypothetical protein|nr:hypothetical protein [Opitutaceae bacterium]
MSGRPGQPCRVIFYFWRVRFRRLSRRWGLFVVFACRLRGERSSSHWKFSKNKAFFKQSRTNALARSHGGHDKNICFSLYFEWISHRVAAM